MKPVGDGLILLSLAWPKAKSYFLHKSQGVVVQMYCTSTEAAIGITQHSWYWFGFGVYELIKVNFFVLLA